MKLPTLLNFNLNIITKCSFNINSALNKIYYTMQSEHNSISHYKSKPVIINNQNKTNLKSNN